MLVQPMMVSKEGEGAFTRENYRRLRARRSIKKEEKKPLRPVASANHMLKWLSPDNTLSR